MDVLVRKSELYGEAIPPPSKSYTHRALISAALSPLARIQNPLISEDTIATLNFCRFMGAEVQRIREGLLMGGANPHKPEGYVYLANSGTTLRIALGILSLSKSRKYSVVDGDGSLRERPNEQLVRALKQLGAEIRGSGNYEAPLWIRGVIKGKEIEMRADSSQYISSLLYALSIARGNSVLKVTSMKSKPYVDITLHVLKESGVEIEVEEGENTCAYHIPQDQDHCLRQFEVPADFSSASYLIAAGLLGGRVKINNVFNSMQGDKIIVDAVEEMGGRVSWNKEKGVLDVEKSQLVGIDFDGGNYPDLVPAIAALAAVARGRSRIYNAAHLRMKEIDRIEGICRNLRALKVDARETEDGMEIEGGSIEGGTVNSFGDHRMALAFSLLGLVGEKEVKVQNAEKVSVSYPGFFDVLRSLGADLSTRGN
ncbi:MAG: 3-phosphoshikimate 1-carboxyvinyltransferase [Archaeoglobaceae archaeon]